MDWEELLGNRWWQSASKLVDSLYRREQGNMYPQRSLVFQALREVQPYDVSVVILGQDPYHSPGKARGVAFGYHPDYKGPINSSLLNIITEAGGHPDTFDTTLRSWTSQGVLLLNTRLTVPHERPMGHAGLGWEPLMQEALNRIVRWGQPVVVSWGAEARKMADRSGAWNRVDTSHPCRYSASRGNNPFLGSGCFDKVNKLLMDNGECGIRWTE